MAQGFIPENPRERERLQGTATTHEVSYETTRGSRAARRFSLVDLIIVLTLLATLAFLITAAARWTAPLNPSVSIDLSPTALPLYAGYSLLRMALGYVLSLVFTLIYGHIAATNQR